MTASGQAMEPSHTLLIAEDSAVQRVLLERLLKRSGYPIWSAKDGLEGLALVRAYRPDLVISDVTMPNMDGYALCQAIKQDPALHHIPVLLLTGLDDAEEVIHGLMAGADCYLTKPVDDAYLLEQIHRLLGLSDTERGAGGPEGMTISFGGKSYTIKAGRRQTLNLLISTYENAVRKNRELILAQQTIQEKDALLIETVQAASRAKSAFIANLSHEIRTPMNAIMGFTDLALRAEPNATIQDYLEKVAKASQTLMGCLNDILDFSKIEAGKLELHPIPFDIHDLFDQLADMFGDQAADKGLELIFSIPADYFPSLVGDAKRVQQVFINLIRNATKFTDHGTILVRAHPAPMTNGSVKLHFSVRDTGIGIEAERIDALFSPFAQADSSIAIRYGGSGLGLNICKQLVGLMNGHVWVESQLGKGSTFHFTIVLESPAQATPSWIVPEHLRDIRILVVDDHDLTREVMEEMLRGLGLSSSSAASGEEAVTNLLTAQTAGKPFHLVFMDWRMPGMDGIEATMVIRARLSAAFPQAVMPKIIMLTAFGKKTIQNFARNAGVTLFLHKPVTRIHLFNAILEVSGQTVPKPDRLEEVLTEELAVTARIGGARILLAEDNAINQQVAQELLVRVGLHVEIANNGLEAVQRLAQSPFDLVLMDVQMPEMDGYEATARIRQEARFAHLPIIAMTAHVLSGIVEKSQAAGMNDYVAKPIDIKQLYATLIRWLNPHGDHPGLGTGRSTQPPAEEILLPPQLDGIDLAVAMERFRGQQRFFKKMLLEMVRYTTAADDIKQAVAQDDWHTAQDMVHTMKGMAGNLAATDLYRAADRLEIALDQGRIREEPLLLVHFEEALHRILTTVRGLESTPKGTPQAEKEMGAEGVASMTPIESCLRQLAHFLQTHDTDAELAMDELKTLLTGNNGQASLHQMADQIDRLDYPQALVTLETLAHALGVVMTEHGR